MLWNSHGAWRSISRFFPLLLLVALGCITVNLYFPETELRRAAEEIVNDVRPELPPVDPHETQGGSNDPSQPSTGSGEREANDKKAFLWRRREAKGFLASFGPRLAYAEGEKKVDEQETKEKKGIKLEVSTPVIDRIRETLKKRYAKLLPFYEKGAIGEGRDGYLALRETEKLSLKEKRDVQLYLDEENKDRKNLYTELARENKIESSEIARIGALFSLEWQKKTKVGWWIEKEKGKWERKREEKKK